MRLHALARGLIMLAVVLTLPADAMALTAPSWVITMGESAEIDGRPATGISTSRW